jgi:hypothetical protein
MQHFYYLFYLRTKKGGNDMEISKEELQQIINEAVLQDRDKRLTEQNEKVISRFDIDSSAYNTNLLFRDLRHDLSKKCDDLYQSCNYKCPYDKLAYYPAKLTDMIREIILVSFNCRSNIGVPIKDRRKARKMYKELEQVLFPVYAESVQRMGSE